MQTLAHTLAQTSGMIVNNDGMRVLASSDQISAVCVGWFVRCGRIPGKSVLFASCRTLRLIVCMCWPALLRYAHTYALVRCVRLCVECLCRSIGPPTLCRSRKANRWVILLNYKSECEQGEIEINRRLLRNKWAKVIFVGVCVRVRVGRRRVPNNALRQRRVRV